MTTEIKHDCTNDNVVYYGSDIKVGIHLDLGGVAAETVPFEVEFKVGNASLTLKKEQLIKVDENNYIACIKAPNTEKGALKAYVHAELPDTDFEDNVHNIITLATSNIVII